MYVDMKVQFSILVSPKIISKLVCISGTHPLVDILEFEGLPKRLLDYYGYRLPCTVYVDDRFTHLLFTS